jgi:hypothetical protein
LRTGIGSGNATNFLAQSNAIFPERRIIDTPAGACPVAKAAMVSI